MLGLVESVFFFFFFLEEEGGGGGGGELKVLCLMEILEKSGRVD